MTIGVPLLEARVAPRCTRANRLLLVKLSSGGAVSNRTLDVQIGAAEELIELARVHGITMLVCGGITRECRTLLELHKIQVIENVAGSAAEVLRGLEQGMLREGFGLDPATLAGLAAAPGTEAPPLPTPEAGAASLGAEPVQPSAVGVPSVPPETGPARRVLDLARLAETRRSSDKGPRRFAGWPTWCGCAARRT
jgi:predicted Fe-Mo cluster-binding NifX family protein